MASEETPLTMADRVRITQEIADDILGYGPIEPFLRDPDITEVMVNGPHDIWIERSGRLQHVDGRFNDEAHLRRTIEKIVARIGRRIDESSPMCDARLPDGSRVNAVVPPLALDGSLLTIRKFSADPFTVDDLVVFGTISQAVADLLNDCVRGRLNILVSGGTGAGKTTTLNVLSSFIPADERIITIEDAAELRLHQDHVLRLESRPANIEGKGEVKIRDLVRNSLRMRPDRIVVGEIRDAAALDMLQAMNTGHDGSISTLHANTPRDALSRLETMVMMSGMDLPVRAIREQVSSAVDLIIQQTRLKDGTRRITYVTEVAGMEGDIITLQDLFTFDYGAGFDDAGRSLGSLRSRACGRSSSTSSSSTASSPTRGCSCWTAHCDDQRPHRAATHRRATAVRRRRRVVGGRCAAFADDAAVGRIDHVETGGDEIQVLFSVPGPRRGRQPRPRLGQVTYGGEPIEATAKVSSDNQTVKRTVGPHHRRQQQHEGRAVRGRQGRRPHLHRHRSRRRLHRSGDLRQRGRDGPDAHAEPRGAARRRSTSSQLSPATALVRRRAAVARRCRRHRQPQRPAALRRDDTHRSHRARRT